MEHLSGFFSVDPGELGLMRGVSEAYQTVLRGLTWRRGDQILTSEEEEGSVLMPTLHLRDLFGVEVVKFPLVDDLRGQVDAVAKRITDCA